MNTPEFVAEEGSLRGLVLALSGGDEWKIGRDPEQCDLVVEDPKASRLHLICRRTDEGFVVENFSQSNPIQINDVPLTDAALLNDGDKVRIGGTVFHFYLEGAPDAIHMIQEPEEPEETPQETIFQEEEGEVQFDLSQTSRFVLKVIAGPNTGAECALDFDSAYLIGTDESTCDIVFHDLSVSREHARLSVSKEGEIEIEDLGSRNGVVVDRERITGTHSLPANTVVTIGTSAFLVLDREAPAMTIAAPVLEPLEAEESVEEEAVSPASRAAEAALPRTGFPFGSLILGLMIVGLVVLFGIGMVSLFRTTEVTAPQPDYLQEIHTALSPFPGVRYTYNPATGKLFLVGHVATAVNHSELQYNLRGLSFLKGIEDNVVVDEAIWQEMNILLSKNPAFQGGSMHSPAPGVFVLTGYLQKTKQSAQLSEYMNLHFNYLDRLENRVVVEEQVLEEVESDLLQEGFNGVSASFKGGELILTGYINAGLSSKFDMLSDQFEKIPGVRIVRNFVVPLSPEQAVVDLSKEFPGRYKVTGYSKHGDVNFNVVINGKIYARGDTIDGMKIMSIQPHTIFLGKEGLKYKIDYNK